LGQATQKEGIRFFESTHPMGKQLKKKGFASSDPLTQMGQATPKEGRKPSSNPLTHWGKQLKKKGL
jgi:hypothetical protein